MASSQRLDTKLDCLTCDRKRAGFLCQLSPKAFEEFLAIRHNLKYPSGTILFLEKEQARGLLLLCSGNVKLSFSSSTGKTLVLRIAKPGDVRGNCRSPTASPDDTDSQRRFLAIHPNVSRGLWRCDWADKRAVHERLRATANGRPVDFCKPKAGPPAPRLVVRRSGDTGGDANQSSLDPRWRHLPKANGRAMCESWRTLSKEQLF